jgi:hypothetical protein
MKFENRAKISKISQTVKNVEKCLQISLAVLNLNFSIEQRSDFDKLGL